MPCVGEVLIPFNKRSIGLVIRTEIILMQPDYSAAHDLVPLIPWRV